MADLAQRINARDHENIREIEVQRFYAHNCRACRPCADIGRLSLAALRKHSAALENQCASSESASVFCRDHAGKRPNGLTVTPVLRLAVSDAQGADVQPKMSLLPKVDGQSCCGAGGGTDSPVRSDMRHASMVGQSAALRVSFQTAAPYVVVAIA
jgi:hypothetical protein